MAVLIPFTGGVESTYLVQKALEDKREVVLGYFGVTQSALARLPEIVARRHMIDYFRTKYKNQIITECYGFFEHMCQVPKENTFSCSSLRQQWNLVNNLIAANTIYNHNGVVLDAIWIGWAGYDTSEYSLSNIDFSAAEYEQFRQMFADGLYLSSFDKSMKKPFLPLMNEMSKKDILNRIDPELHKWIIGNGQGYYRNKEETVEHAPYSVKETEYKDSDVPVNTFFPMVELNPAEQALVEFQHPEYYNIPMKYNGYRRWLNDIDIKYHSFLKTAITRVITGSMDKIYRIDGDTRTFQNVDGFIASFKLAIKPISELQKETTTDAS